MSYLPLLTEDETRYICSVIPQKDVIAYFQHNPKEFALICPGFRANAVTRLNVGNLLFHHRNRGFVSAFIEKHIRNWLPQIQKHVANCIEDGDNEDLAYIHTLPHSFFAGNVTLYYKLIKHEHPDVYIALMGSAVKAINDAIEEQKNLQITLKRKESEFDHLQQELDSNKSKLKNTEVTLKECLVERKEFERTNTYLEKLKETIRNCEEVILELKAKIQEQEETTQKLRSELSVAKDRQQHLCAEISADLRKQQSEKTTKQTAKPNPKCPKDMADFKDYLGYNLYNVGLPAGAEYNSLLKEHLSCILFQGIPIVINRGIGMTLIRCIANALIGMSNVETLAFKTGISIQAIDDFLSINKRIVCLDNFIGNFNETELLPLFDRHKNIIIFLTVAYDRTLYFISEEFLKYCHYLNLNRIGALSVNPELTEDPSIVEEIDVVYQRVNPDSRYSLLFREIISEFSISQSLVTYKGSYISCEQDLCRMLAFDILPYCVDVLHITPYNESERFVRYAGDAGRCPYKNLFKEWFSR